MNGGTPFSSRIWEPQSEADHLLLRRATVSLRTEELELSTSEASMLLSRLFSYKNPINSDQNSMISSKLN